MNYGKVYRGRNSAKTYSAYKREYIKRFEKVTQVKPKTAQLLVLKSTSAKLLAIRQITQLNKGKKTAGVDGVKSLNFLQRFQTYYELKEVKKWKPNELRRIPIPKKNGKVRILSVPTIFDRIWQCLIKYALEPAARCNISL